MLRGLNRETFGFQSWASKAWEAEQPDVSLNTLLRLFSVYWLFYFFLYGCLRLIKFLLSILVFFVTGVFVIVEAHIALSLRLPTIGILIKTAAFYEKVR